jgi:hypothetical protein
LKTKTHDRIFRTIREREFDIELELGTVEEPGQQLEVFKDPFFKIVIYQYQNSVYFFV